MFVALACVCWPIGFTRAFGRGTVLACVFIAALAAQPACARQMVGVTFVDTIRVEHTLFTLNGTAALKRFGVRVLVAGLWLEHKHRDAATILREDAPRRYVTHFLHGVSSKRICRAWKEGLEANSPDASPEVRQQFLELCGWIRDFHPGDEIAVTYLPGHGSLVDVNGARLGVILGKAFADAYFACAIGPKPGPGGAFKTRLLGG
jgi:chalcone isomerase-like protein